MPDVLVKDKNSLKSKLSREIIAGIADAKDPENAGLPDDAVRVTTLYSPWYTRICPECRLKFREDDQVRQCPKCGQAYHDDAHYGLRCWPHHFKDNRICKPPRKDPITDIYQKGCDNRISVPNDNPADMDDTPSSTVQQHFMQGLQNIWRPFGEEHIRVVEKNDGIVGLKCPWCRFYIRAGDHVVKCPCGGKCNTWFHMDVYRHLTCWNEWNGAKGHDFCPTTGLRIERR